MLDQTEKKSVLRLFTYGLYVVTCAHSGETNAFTANWLTQISFDPPMVAVSIERNSASLPMILASGMFAVSVIGSADRELAGALGRSRLRVGDKLVSIQHSMSDLGLPLLAAALGYVECRVTGNLPSGDSVIVAGEVVQAKLQRSGDSLTMTAAGFKHSG